MFNFGAFAGGLATAIQTQQKLNLEEKKYDDDIKASNAKLKQEENKALAEILKQVDEHNKNVSNLSLGMSKAEDETQYNTYVSELKAANENFKANAKSQLDNYANTPLGQKMETLFNGARISDVEQVEKTTIKDANGNVVETYIPQSLVQDKDNLVLMENGRFGIAQVGQDGKISGYQPTNIAPVKFKTPEGKSSFGVINGKEGFYTNEQLANATAQGMSVERSKDKPATTKVEVKMQQAQQDYSEAFDLGTKVIGGDKSIPLKDLAVAQSKVLSSDYGKTESVKNLEKDSAGLHKNLMSLKALEKDIDAIADDPAFENQYKTAFNEVITKYIPENFYELSPSDKEATYQSLRAKGKMGDALAQYLKSNSGTAASEKEAIRNLTNMFGGENISLMSPKSIRNSLSGFIDTRVESAKVLAQDASDSGLPLNAKKLKDVIDAHTPSGTKKVEVSKDIQDLLKSNNVPYEPEKYEYNIIDGKLKRRLINGK